MSQIVVDTAEAYADALRGSELILSFMSVAELRMGAISAGWGERRRLLLEKFIRSFELFYADNDLCMVWARIRSDARAAGRVLSRRMPGSPRQPWRSMLPCQRTTGGIMSTFRDSVWFRCDRATLLGTGRQGENVRSRSAQVCPSRAVHIATSLQPVDPPALVCLARCSPENTSERGPGK